MLSAGDFQKLESERAGLPAEVLETRLEALLQSHADDPRLWFLLGAVRQRSGRADAALQAFDRTLLLDDAHLEAYNHKAGLLAHAGQRAAAIEVLEFARTRFPGACTLLVNLGFLYEQQEGGGPRALACYDQALAADPGNRHALMNRGYLLAVLGCLPEAVENNRRFVERHPMLAAAHFNLAETLLAVRQYDGVVEASSRALALEPGYTKALLHRALALAILGRFDEADGDLRRAGRADPAALAEFRKGLYGDACQVFEDIDVRCIYLHMLYQAVHECDWSRWQEFVDAFKRLIEDAAANAAPIRDSSLLFPSLAFPIGGKARLQLARGVSDALRARQQPAAARSIPAVSRKDRIRLGYVSPDFRRHPGGYLTRRLFGLHDRSRFEVFAYATDPDDGSEIRDGIRADCDRFRECAALSPDQTWRAVTDDRIDIAIDRSGFMRMARPEIFARRVAPVQVSYLGFPGTTGSGDIDYAIVDATVCPEGDDMWWSEKLVRLPNSYFITNNRQRIDDAPLRRSDLGLPETGTVFCCFNNPYKIDPATFDVWMRILSRVPGSVLWLYGPRREVESNLRREAAARHVAPERLVFAPHLPRQESHLARHCFADLFLDTRFYNAHTTAVDALWCGVPLLTVPGDTLPSRVGASLLKAAGMPELICGSWAEYENRAVSLATDGGELGRLRKAVAASRSSPLFDTEAFVADLELAYEHMWRRREEGCPPAAFHVHEVRR